MENYKEDNLEGRNKDTEIDPTVRERLEAQEHEDELSRRIRREVRRVQSGDADEDIAEDERREAEEQEQAQEEQIRETKRKNRVLSQMFSGNILLRDNVKRLYPHLAFLAVVIFVSMIIKFYAIRLNIQRSRLQDHVELLHERSVELSTQKYRVTSREYIIQQMRQLGIELKEIPTQTKVVD